MIHHRICCSTAAVALVICLPLLSTLLWTSAVMGQVGQRLEIPSSFNPVGSGARALGMGGAFIGVADDATAASWNPGGLIQLETSEISFVAAYVDRTEDLEFGSQPEASGEQGVSFANLNYFSAAYPFSLLNRNMILSLNYQHLYDLNREWELTFDHNTTGFSGQQDVVHTAEGSLSAIGLAYAVQLTPAISLGLTLNFWTDGLYKNQWETEDINTWNGTASGIGTVQYKTVDYTKYDYSGFNCNLGFLWAINHRFTVGAVFKAPFTANVDRFEETYEFENDMTTPSAYSSNEKSQKLDMPMSYGLGLAYRFSDTLTASLDIFRTEWEDFILTDENGNRTSAISLLPENESDVEATTQMRLGTEYLLITDRFIFPFRGGLFYDPAPAEGDPDDYYGFSIGSGIARGRWVFDLAYQFRFGNDVTEYIYEGIDFSQDVRESTVYVSLIVHF